MHRAADMRTLLSAFFFAFLLHGQNQITLSGGFACSVGGAACGQSDTAPTVGATYSRRVVSFVWAEAGVFAALQPTDVYINRFGTFPRDSHFIWAPFGARGTWPLTRRFEISAGAGGVYENFSIAENYGVGPFSHEGWGGYVTTGTALALDRKRHLWLGASSRFVFINRSSDRWLMFTGDLGYRF